MKILHLICTYPPYKGGMGNSVARIALALARNDSDVTVITPSYKNCSSKETGAVEVQRLRPFFSLGNAAILPGLFFKLKKFDILHLHYPFYGTHLCVLLGSIIWKKPLVMHYHMDTEASGLKGLIFRFNRALIEPFMLKRAARIIGSTSDYLQNSHIAQYTEKHPEKISIVPFGLDNGYFHEPAQNKRHSLLFVGGLDRAHYFKGIPILLEAIRLTKEAGKLQDWVLEIVGNGDMLVSYMQLAEEKGIKDAVIFSPKIEDMELKEKYRTSGALILPSINRGEAFGIVLIEAMAAGTPVIASDLPGVRSVFCAPEQGLLTEPGNAQSLSDAIIKMISDESYRSAASKSAYDFALANYREDIVTQKFKDIYIKLTNENSVD